MLIPTTGALEIPPDAGAEIEKVLLRLKYCDLLAKPRCARPLVFERLCFDYLDHHDV